LLPSSEGNVHRQLQVVCLCLFSILEEIETLEEIEIIEGIEIVEERMALECALLMVCARGLAAPDGTHFSQQTQHDVCEPVLDTTSGHQCY
jgi:hypothetical protein